MKEICQRFVLPLAGPPGGDCFASRQADEPHLRTLADRLKIDLTVQNVARELNCLRIRGSTEGQSCCVPNVHLSFDGQHYELLYKH